MPIHSTPQPEPRRDASPAPADDLVEDGAAAGSQIVDLSVLRSMEDEFTDITVVTRFAQDFCESLEGKIDRIEDLLATRDTAGTADATHSVTTSSMMVGAVQLTQVALAVQDLVAKGAIDGARRSLDELRASARLTVPVLRAAYPGSGSAPY